MALAFRYILLWHKRQTFSTPKPLFTSCKQHALLYNAKQMMSVETLLLFGQVALLVLISGTCSGLNIALMTLDLADIRRKAKIGDKNARKVLPFRRNYHLTLGAILFTNVGAVSASSLVLENALNGILAGIITTFLMVIFGEIMPQALFTKQALQITSTLTPLMRIMIVLTYPFARPLQLLLDKLFKPASHPLQTRHELGLLISEHLGPQAESELDEDEVEIIRGALQLSEKRAREIMTPIDKVFWLTPETLLNTDILSKIKQNEHSRIPIFNKELTICYGILLIKDLIHLPTDNSPVIGDLPLHPTNSIGSMVALDTLFRKFITGRAHLSPVERDDKFVGIVTIEDLLEEIVGHEIEDESDHRRHKNRKTLQKK